MSCLVMPCPCLLHQHSTATSVDLDVRTTTPKKVIVNSDLRFVKRASHTQKIDFFFPLLWIAMIGHLPQSCRQSRPRYLPLSAFLHLIRRGLNYLPWAPDPCLTLHLFATFAGELLHRVPLCRKPPAPRPSAFVSLLISPSACGASRGVRPLASNPG